MDSENKLRILLKEMTSDEIDLEEQDGIITSAMRHLGNKNASESEMLDAILLSFDKREAKSPSQIVVDNPDNFDQILETLSAGIRIAGNTMGLSENDDYDQKARTYRRRGRKRTTKEEIEFKIDDAAHEDPAFGPATEARGTHRTRKDMLARR